MDQAEKGGVAAWSGLDGVGKAPFSLSAPGKRRIFLQLFVGFY
jgi:hypothetical protein